MTLYEIDSRLKEMMDNAIDPETGELIADPVEWESLQMAWDEKVENTAIFIKDLRADALKLKAEEENLVKRRKRLERKADWLESNLKNRLQGQPFETARCSIKFRKNQESVSYTSEADAMAWATEYAHDLINFGKPTLSKMGIKKLLQEGTEIPGAELVRTVSMKIV